MREILKYKNFRIEEYLWDIVLLLILSLFVSDSARLLIKVLAWAYLQLSLGSGFEFPLSNNILNPVVWIVLYLTLKWLWELIRSLISTIFKNTYSFDSEITNNKIDKLRIEEEWFSQGNVLPYEGGLLVTNSNSGSLIKPNFLKISRVWKDFEACIDLVFLVQIKEINGGNKFNPYLGVVFRAQNLEDYLMLEFCKINSELVIRPHIRVGGNWDAPILNPDKNSCTLNTFTDKVINLKIVAKGNLVKIYINQRKDPLEWIIPSHFELNLIQHNSSEPVAESSKTIMPIYFRNMAGMFGFRNYGNELAWVKSLKISNL